MDEHTPPMELIEAYYAVADDIRHRIEIMISHAEMLEKMADHMSELRVKAPPTPSAGPAP